MCVCINIYMHIQCVIVCRVKLYLVLRVCWIPEIYIYIHRDLKRVKMLLI